MSILTTILTSAAFVAIITGIKELILWKLNRKATVEDKEENDVLEQLSKHLKESDTNFSEIKDSLDKISNLLGGTTEALKYLLGDKIERSCMMYLERKHITIDQRNELIKMWNIYHFTLNGNGTYDDLMAEVRELPTEITNKIV